MRKLDTTSRLTAPASRRRGYTLLELVASMLSAAILILGLMSSLYIASKSTDAGSTAAPSTLKSAKIVEQIANELNTATSFTVRDDDTIEFTVPDRDGNGSDETIRYEWSATVGDPLQRKLNTGDLFDFAQNVHDFRLEYETYSVTVGSVTTTYLTRVIITLQVSAFDSASTTSSCQILNQPEIVP